MLDLSYLDDYEVERRFEPFKKLADQIDQLESEIRTSLFLRDMKRAKKKEEELALLRKEVKLKKDRQRAYW